MLEKLLSCGGIRLSLHVPMPPLYFGLPLSFKMKFTFLSFEPMRNNVGPRYLRDPIQIAFQIRHLLSNLSRDFCKRLFEMKLSVIELFKKNEEVIISESMSLDCWPKDWGRCKVFQGFLIWIWIEVDGWFS